MANRLRDRVRLTHLITTDPVSWHRVDTLRTTRVLLASNSRRKCPRKKMESSRFDDSFEGYRARFIATSSLMCLISIEIILSKRKKDGIF